MIWLVCVAAFLVGIWLWCLRKLNPNAPPELPGGLPLIGHVHLISGNSIHLWKFIKNGSSECLKLGGVISVRFGGRTIYAVTDPQDFLTLSNACIQKDAFYEFGKPWIGEGLITGIPAIATMHRKLINPAFNQQVLDGFINIFNRQGRKFVSEFSREVGQGPFDQSVYTHRFALETIFLTAFGVNDINKDFCDKYLHEATEVLSIFVKRFQNYLLHHNFIFNLTSLKRKQDKCVKILHQISNTILKTRKANYLQNKESEISDGKETTGSKFKPFMDLLLELAIEKEALNDREIREEIDTIVAAGHETVANTLTYVTLLIGSYPRVQEKMIAELLQVFGSEDRDVTKHDLSQLVYMETVLKESMRLYPVIPMFARRLEKDVKLSKYTLLGGTTCVLLAYGIHRHSYWGPDPEEFKPERWLDPDSLFSSAGAFTAFSLGKRACLGRGYALMAMKTILTHLLRSYTIKGDHTKMVLKLEVILKPDTGYFIELERRNKNSHRTDHLMDNGRIQN